MPDFITTYTGIHFYPTQPDINDIEINDIAHALSMQCRGNGHVKYFLSVGQHCIRCAREALARGYGERIALICLLHDASEAYMSDVPRPTKKEMPQYVAWEEALLELVYQKYLETLPTKQELDIMKQIDDDVLYYDLKCLLGETGSDPAPVMQVPFQYEKFEAFEDVEKQYLELFLKLC